MRESLSDLHPSHSLKAAADPKLLASRPSTTKLIHLHLIPVMLRATEQLTWLAKLEKFDRGQSKPTAVGRPGGGSGVENFAWQHFSGDNLSCKVLFTQPSDKQWPSIGAKNESTEPVWTRPPTMDRQLRIIVECGSAEMNGDESGVGSQGSSTGPRLGSSQPKAPIILV